MSKDLSIIEQLDLFIANIIDVIPKGDTKSMEFPLFSVSSKISTEPFRYKNPETGASIEIIPNEKGRATIMDKDVLLYCFGQIIEAKNRGLPVSPRIHITLYDFLKFAKRGTGGRSYALAKDSLERLVGTTIYTKNIYTTHIREQAFSFITEYDSKCDHITGKLLHVIITLPSVIFDAINNLEVLTYTSSYFKLGPYDRRLYEICRKYCGVQKKWEIGLEKLYTKFGTVAEIKEFRRNIKIIIKKQCFPDYEVVYTPKSAENKLEKITVYPKK